ncbi:hypothetical protein DH2020_013386 [Rehmannia glutinosa]|uniref:CBS domain-containing protein n=1 Tax=Rehmannia glutinosa TaxID=99300 RepID=A0ABR0X5A2_REHGL
MLDVLAHIAGNDDAPAVEGGGGGGGELERKMQVPVSTIIGHCLESLSLWTLNYNTSILDCMEVFSKGIHRALVPVDGHLENVGGVELMESASSYHMVTQMDLIKFLKGKDRKLVGTFSATDLRGCPISQLQSCLHMNIVDFLEKLLDTPQQEACGLRTSTREHITCQPESLLREVVDKAINSHVHRVWVVDGRGLLAGLVSLTDIIRVIRVRGWLMTSQAKFVPSIIIGVGKIVRFNRVFHEGFNSRDMYLMQNKT